MDGMQTKEKEIKRLKWIVESFVLYYLILKVFFTYKGKLPVP